MAQPHQQRNPHFAFPTSATTIPAPSNFGTIASNTAGNVISDDTKQAIFNAAKNIVNSNNDFYSAFLQQQQPNGGNGSTMNSNNANHANNPMNMSLQNALLNDPIMHLNTGQGSSASTSTNANANANNNGVVYNNNQVANLPPMDSWGTLRDNFVSPSRRVSMSNSSVMSEGSVVSAPSLAGQPSPGANIANGNEFHGVYNNPIINNIHNIHIDPIPSMPLQVQHQAAMNGWQVGAPVSSIMVQQQQQQQQAMQQQQQQMQHAQQHAQQQAAQLQQQQQAPNNGIISEPGSFDIVCGRNSYAHNHIGNRRFKATIERNLQRYVDAPTKEDKTNIIKSIVWMLQEQVGARFLKKERFEKSRSGRRGTPQFSVMSDKQAREKVGHAIRDLVLTKRKAEQEGAAAADAEGAATPATPTVAQL